VTDAHIRILRLVARQRRNELEDHSAAEPSGETASAGRRRRLERAATRTGLQVEQAKARRRHPALGVAAPEQDHEDSTVVDAVTALDQR
jgi:hypothetical protein